MSEIYPQNPVQRFIDTVVPKADIADLSNPILRKLTQLPGFGWHSQCTPQMAGVKLRESFGHISAPTLVQHVANAKRQADQAIIELVDGELPVWLRKPKYIYDVAKMIQLMEQIVATLNFLISVLRQEVALANAWANEGLLFVNYIQQSISPPALRVQAETELLAVLGVATSAITQQINENNASLACLI
jgi:hypothetical protein